jgi:hypothetical protein
MFALFGGGEESRLFDKDFKMVAERSKFAKV